MIRVRHRYALLFLRQDGSLITQGAAEPDGGGVDHQTGARKSFG